MKFWPHLEGETDPNDGKHAIFQKWLDTRPKMQMHEPNVYPTIYWPTSLSRDSGLQLVQGGREWAVDPGLEEAPEAEVEGE